MAVVATGPTSQRLRAEVENLKAALMEAESNLESAELAHNTDTKNLLDYLLDIGAHPRKGNAVEQILQFCNAITRQRDTAVASNQDSQKQLRSLRSYCDSLKGTNEHLTQQLEILKAENKKDKSNVESAEKKYQDAKKKSDKADEQRKAAVQKAVADLNLKISKQNGEIESLRRKIEYHNTELEKLRRDHQQAMNNIEATWNANAQALKTQHEEEENRLKEQHEKQEQSLKALHEQDTNNLIDDFEEESAILKKRLLELASGPTDDFRPATDQALRIKFLRLRNHIQNITLPDNLFLPRDEGSGPGVLTVPAKYDSHGFVKRQKDKDLLLRWLVWEELIKGLFSKSFGFGCLGHGAGLNKLLAIHGAWVALYEPGNQLYMYEDELAIYRHDTNANKCRSAIFQSFMPVIFPSKDQVGQPQQQQQQQANLAPQQFKPLSNAHPLPPLPPPFLQQPSPGNAVSSSGGGGGGASGDDCTMAAIAAKFQSNCEAIAAQIKSLLNQFTDNSTRSDALASVTEVVREAAELGIECGVQRAQLVLLAPKNGQMVLTGEEYQDCTAGSASGGGSGLANGKVNGTDLTMRVDFVVSPGLVRIGDGRNDTTTRKVLVPCEVFPYR